MKELATPVFFTAYENTYLVEAENADEAFSKSESIGASLEGDAHGSFSWNGVPAKLVFFRGVRKCVEVSSPRSIQNLPEDGTELTYSLIDFKDQNDLRSYVEGASVSVNIVE